MTAHFTKPVAIDADPARGCGEMSFAAGTYIATTRGEIAIEALTVGQRVLTRDNGLQKVLWVGTVEVALTRAEDTPVRIRAGALGAGLPQSDLIVAPAHRVLVFGAIAQEMFGCSEAFVTAANLTFLPGIARLPAATMTYHQVLFARHEVILSNGAWTESLQPAPQDAGEGLAALFPALAEIGGPAVSARPVVRPRL
ncbi:Hint domain-containing protein [Roseisalinus antarcticus]|uniref:Hedgehog/Intein (Hint) domain-containing protein n=1 Tax=Roseisalinus antarcticus TaxID=254357 RepID=A0A1Y5TGX1_9RHOB|nr:Hint domain-containing protein [Roseisalinus antarcticus]SLN60144.1 hypothetical protein ROA7023_02780 [Roseisalinus antarcticus]